MGPELFTPTHLIFLAILGLLVFGPKRLPEIGRSLGTGLREFKSTIGGVSGIADVTKSLTEPAAPVPPAAPAARGCTPAPVHADGRPAEPSTDDAEPPAGPAPVVAAALAFGRSAPRPGGSMCAVGRQRAVGSIAFSLQNPVIGAVSSVGRAPARQAGGHWFEPSTAHRTNTLEMSENERVPLGTLGRFRAGV